MFGLDPKADAAVARERRQKMLMFLLVAGLAAGALLWILAS